MSSKRFMVRGKRTDTGEWVEGLLTENGYIVEVQDIEHSDLKFAVEHEIDLDTIEPVAVGVKVIIREPPVTTFYHCPDCNYLLYWIDENTAAGKWFDYCPCCGQRLDWQEVQP